MKVSVCCITYNHSNFIAESIESALNQKTSFDFEIVIGEDASTDDTGNICAAFAKSNSNSIRFFSREKNLGIQNNFIETLKECKGEYIALLEGDDYWIDENKLQMQADFLDSNPDCSFCITNAYSVVDGSTERKSFLKNNQPVKTGIKEFLAGKNHIPHATKMWRRSSILVSEIPEYFFRTTYTDVVLHAMNFANGNCGYIDKFTAVYRIHKEGVILKTSLENSLREGIVLHEFLDNYFSHRYHLLLQKRLSKFYIAFAKLYFSKRNFPLALKYFWKTIATKVQTMFV